MMSSNYVLYLVINSQLMHGCLAINLASEYVNMHSMLTSLLVYWWNCMFVCVNVCMCYVYTHNCTYMYVCAHFTAVRGSCLQLHSVSQNSKIYQI